MNLSYILQVPGKKEQTNKATIRDQKSIQNLANVESLIARGL